MRARAARPNTMVGLQLEEMHLYSKDVGSGFAVHGGCDTPPRYEGDWKAPRTLEEAMRGQSPRNYNEVCATRHPARSDGRTQTTRSAA